VVSFAKNYFKMKTRNELSISQWLDVLLSKGLFSFSREMLQIELTGMTEIAIKRGLNRLCTRGKIVSLYKGYYLIITPQYSSKGILPPPLFIDAFMKHLTRAYYISLLNAAVYHGSSHQQPQEYFVMTSFPVLRPTIKKGLKINYISVRTIPDALIETRKTEAGYMKISNAVLTACDLIQFEKRIGGMTRAAIVLKELSDEISPSDFSSSLINHIHITSLQRLGYVLETVCKKRELADALFQAMVNENLRFFRIPLKAGKIKTGFSSDNRWNVIVNLQIEIEE
jgi:predicted transcriptional regulator of viral defense system